MTDEDRGAETDGTYRVLTFHTESGGPPTLALSEMHTSARHQIAMRATPDLPDDPGSLPVALDAPELVHALASICQQLDEGGPPQGATDVFDDRMRIHWYLRDHLVGDDTADGDDLPEEVSPDHLVHWWATANPLSGETLGRTGAARLVARLRLPGLEASAAADPMRRLTSALAGLDGLVGDTYATTEITSLAHEGGTIALGPSRYQRAAQIAASTEELRTLWTNAAMAATVQAERVAERVLPELTGHAGNDLRRNALSDALLGWVTGLTLASDLGFAEIAHLVAPVAVVLRPTSLRPVDHCQPFGELIATVLDDGRWLLDTLEPASRLADPTRITRARRRLRMALACEHFAGLYLSEDCRARVAQRSPGHRGTRRLERAILDLCAAPFSHDLDPSLSVLRPVGLPDALWDHWSDSAETTDD